MLWMGEVEDAKSIDDLITAASISRKPITDCESLDCTRTQENPDIERRKASHHSRRKSSIREAIT